MMRKPPEMNPNMSSCRRAGPALLLALTIAACSGGGEAIHADDDATSPIAEAAAQGEPARIPATREMLQQAYTCRGLMSAAWAAVQVIPETDRPTELADLTVADSSVWNSRIGSLDASTIPEEEVNTMLAQGTRVLATREALERELPAIAECRKAAADF